MMVVSARLGAAFALIMTPVLIPAAHAQTATALEPGQPETSSQATGIFDTAFFAPYNPVNAADMVGRVPGFEISEGDDRRGFGGNAGNVLINGERPSSKASLSEQLRRIPAGAVQRIELLSGSASGADVRGQGRLVNVVLRPSAQTGNPLTWVIGARHVQYSDRIRYEFQLSSSFRLSEDAELSVDFQAPNIPGRTEGFEVVRDGSGALTRYRQQYNQYKFNGLQAAANLKWRPGQADRLNVNLLYNPADNSIGLGNVEFMPTGAASRSTFGGTEFPNQQRGELGADWEHTFGPDLNIKLVGLATFSETEETQTLSTYVPAGLSNTRRQRSGSETGERIARAVMTWRPDAAHSIEFGAEGAFNFLDNTLSISNQAPGGPVIPLPLQVANTRVEELRAEASATDIWTVAPGLTLETGFVFEASRITQTGDESKEREFTYAKPGIAATWQPDPGHTIRASIRRDVSQLDFGEFATSVNAIDNITLVGNPEITPEQAWKTRFEWDRRFGPRSAITVGIFYDDIEDVRDLIVRDIDPGAAIRLADAFGNLGRGTRTGIDMRGALPLDGMGLPGADFRFSAVYQQTRVTDPVTGQKRSFSSGQNSGSGSRRSSGGSSSSNPPALDVDNRDWGYVMSLRQDLPALKSSWSVNLARNAPREEFKLAELVVTQRVHERLDLSFETTAIAGVTLRLSATNILSPQEERVRTFFSPDRASGVIIRSETRMNKGGSEGAKVYGVQLSGKF